MLWHVYELLVVNDENSAQKDELFVVDENINLR